MDPVTASLLVAANFAISVFSNRQQTKLNKIKNDFELSQVKLQAEESALEATRQYKDYVSYNAALSAMGVGGATGFRSTSSSAASTLNKQINSINRQVRQAEIVSKTNNALNLTNQFISNLNSGIESYKLADDLGIFKKNDKKKLRSK